ncbi:MAG: ABC transporter ATP-binding protein [Actinomycetota bacterium]
MLGLLGPNGAGKTSVVNLLAGLARPSGGDVRWGGRPLPYPFPPEVRRQLGLVPQDTALYQDLSLTQNLRFAADLYGVADRAAAVASALRLAGLEDRASDRVSALSGGMRRRLGLARATLHRPRLLLLDEPTLGVDIENRHAIWGHVRQLRSEGVTVVLSTNYLDEAEALCDRVALREGRQVAQGVPAKLAASVGRCVEIACPPEAVEGVRRRLATLTEIDHLDTEPMGLAATLRAGTDPEPVAEMALRSGGVTAVRIRAPDLAEVFRALATGDGATPGG